MLSKLAEIASKRSFIYALIFGLSLIALLPYIAACFYIHPNADDWRFSYDINELGRLGFVKHYYYNWSGRFFAFFLLSLPKAHIFLSGFWYTLLPILYVISTILILYKLFGLFLIHKIGYAKTIILTIFFTAFYITGLPEVFSALFWNCSSYYLLSNVFFIWLIYLFLKYELLFDNGKIKSFTYLGLISLVLLVCGLTEMYIFSLIVVLVAIIIYKYIKFKSLRYDYIILLSFVFIGAYLNILSPGSQIRMEVSGSNEGFVFSAVRAAYDFMILQVAPLSSSGFLLIGLLVLLTGSYVLNESNQKLFSVHPLISFLVVLLVFYMQHAASVYGAGYTLQGRVLNITNLLFYLSLMYVLMTVIVFFKLKLGGQLNMVFYYTLLCLCISFNFSLNSRIVTKEVFVELPQLDREMNIRYEQIKMAIAEGKNKVILERVTVNPKTLNLLHYWEDRNYYNSEAFCREFGELFDLQVEIKDGEYDIIDPKKNS